MLDNSVFVFGSGRSGTTLLAKLIDSSSQIFYLHEPDKAYTSSELPYLPEVAVYEKYKALSVNYVSKLVSQRAPFCVGKEPFFDKSYRTPFQASLLRFLIPVYKIIDKAHIYLDVPDLVSNDDYRLLIKSVDSIGRVPMFSEAIPNMKFIHIIRHPGAMIASVLSGIENNKMQRNDFVDSVFEMSISADYPFSYEYLSRASFEERTAYVWMLQNDKVFMEMKNNDHYMVVSYEELCVNMKKYGRVLFEFMGIKYDDQTNEFINSMQSAPSDVDYFSVIKNPTSSVSKWEEEIGSEMIDRINSIIEKSEIGRYVMDRYLLSKAQLVQSGNGFCS